MWQTWTRYENLVNSYWNNCISPTNMTCSIACKSNDSFCVGKRIRCSFSMSLLWFECTSLMINLTRNIFIVIFGCTIPVRTWRAQIVNTLGHYTALVWVEHVLVLWIWVKTLSVHGGLGSVFTRLLITRPQSLADGLPDCSGWKVSGPEWVCVHELPCWDVRTCLVGFSGTECQVMWAGNTALCVCVCVCVRFFLHSGE